MRLEHVCGWLVHQQAMPVDSNEALFTSSGADRLIVVQAINIMSLGVDFEITQIVDSNVGIHAKIPK